MLHISSLSLFIFMLCRGGTKCYISAPYHLFLKCFLGGVKCYVTAPYHLFMLCRGGIKCFISAPYHLFLCFVEGAQNVSYQLLITFYFYAL